MARTKSARRPRSSSRLKRFLRGLLVTALVVIFVLPVGLVLTYRFVPPPLTFLMVERAVQGHGIDHRWRSLGSMDPDLARAAIASEDARFCLHHGFDFNALQKAYQHNQDSSRIRGGSTISQQTAKNVFLWVERSYVRKGLEAYFTILIETFWGKRRIMEVYLNTIEMGPGVYGAESAAHHYYGVGANKLSLGQASRIIAILPSPLRYKVTGAGPYVVGRSASIAARAQEVARSGGSACLN